MSQIPVRLTTKEMGFPLVSTQQGPTILSQPRTELTYIPGVSAAPSKLDTFATLGYPGVYYAHNVLPSISGWQSVGYDTILSASGTTGFFDIEMCQGAIIQDDYPLSTSIRTYIGAVYDDVGDTTTLYYRDTAGAWAIPLISTSSLALTLPGKLPMTVANVNGISYIYFPGAPGAYVLDTELGILYLRPLLGLEISTILGILASNGYLIAWSKSAISWSSTVDVEDFVPSDITDAGGGNVQEIKGDITHCRYADLGFIVFSDINTVIGLFTSNSKFPFEFRDVNGAGGVVNQLTVSREDVEGKSYCYTSAGIQAISQVGIQNTLTFIDDFVANRVFEDFDEGTLTLTQQTLTVEMGKAIECVGNRYTVVSYSSGSQTSFTHAIVVDHKLGRIGKLRIPHVGVFPYKDIINGTLQNSKSQMSFLQTDGSLKTLAFDIDSPTVKGVILFGKFQYIRERWIQVQRVDFEGTNKNNNFATLLYPSYDGTALESPIPGFLENSGMFYTSNKSWFFNGAVAKNFSLLSVGGFDLTSLVIHFNIHGKW